MRDSACSVFSHAERGNPGARGRNAAWRATAVFKLAFEYVTVKLKNAEGRTRQQEAATSR